jgi:hypothetical protein
MPTAPAGIIIISLDHVGLWAIHENHGSAFNRIWLNADCDTERHLGIAPTNIHRCTATCSVRVCLEIIVFHQHKQ